MVKKQREKKQDKKSLPALNPEKPYVLRRLIEELYQRVIVLERRIENFEQNFIVLGRALEKRRGL